MNKRLKWSNDHLLWEAEKWKKVILVINSKQSYILIQENIQEDKWEKDTVKNTLEKR